MKVGIKSTAQKLYLLVATKTRSHITFFSGIFQISRYNLLVTLKCLFENLVNNKLIAVHPSIAHFRTWSMYGLRTSLASSHSEQTSLVYKVRVGREAFFKPWLHNLDNVLSIDLLCRTVLPTIRLLEVMQEIIFCHKPSLDLLLSQWDDPQFKALYHLWGTENKGINITACSVTWNPAIHWYYSIIVHPAEVGRWSLVIYSLLE